MFFSSWLTLKLNNSGKFHFKVCIVSQYCLRLGAFSCPLRKSVHCFCILHKSVNQSINQSINQAPLASKIHLTLQVLDIPTYTFLNVQHWLVIHHWWTNGEHSSLFCTLSSLIRSLVWFVAIWQKSEKTRPHERWSRAQVKYEWLQQLVNKRCEQKPDGG